MKTETFEKYGGVNFKGIHFGNYFITETDNGSIDVYYYDECIEARVSVDSDAFGLHEWENTTVERIIELLEAR